MIPDEIVGFVDSHVHLDRLSDPFGALKHADRTGITNLVVIATGIRSLERTLSIFDAYSGPIRFTLAAGIHPERLAVTSEELDRLHSRLEPLAASGLLRAIGEVGLPCYVPVTPIQAQSAQTRFLRQVEWADEWNLPLILHAVHHTAAVAFGLLEPHFQSRVLWHWLKAPQVMLAKIAAAGHFAGLTPELAHRERDRQTARYFGPAQILAETDAPWPHRPRTRASEPSDVKEVFAALTELWAVSPDVVQSRLSHNFTRFFGG